MKSKTIIKLLTVATATMCACAASAESTYGYNGAGTGTVSATGRVTVTVAVPKLLLLRVGTSGATVDTLAFTGAFNGIPGGVAAAALANGSNLASGWDGTAPVFTAPTAQTLTAYAWTNSSGGGQLGLSTTVNTAVGGLSAASVAVTATAVAGTLPAHPATTTTNANFGTFTRNVLHSATWAYSVSAATLAAAAGGTYSQTTTYTATSL